MDDSNSSSERLEITYVVTLAEGEEPSAKVREIAVEQTVELPEGCFPAKIENRIVPNVEALEELGESRWRAVLSYDVVTVGDEIPQLLNILFGNASMKPGIQVTEIDLPPSLLERFPGPTFGIDGVRELCGSDERRPLLCTALKPMGLSSGELAELCFQFALGGIDIIKDDHGLANQSTAPFRERVQQCQAAVARANDRTGGKSLYFPNLTTGGVEIAKHVDFVRSRGCRGVVLSPFLVGFDTVRWVAEHGDLAVLTHPSLSGVFFHGTQGVVAEVMLGKIFRVIGSDGVIYPNVGGRFTFSQGVCEAINSNLRDPLGALRPAFPVPGGGIDARKVPYWIDQYGVDTIFLIGGSLYAQGDLEQASRRLLEAVRQTIDEESVQSH